MNEKGYLFNRNSKKKIYDRFKIPKMSYKKLVASVYGEYIHFYLNKKTGKKILDRPSDFSSSKYRLITFPNKQGWLSKSQKLLYKELLKSTYNRKTKEQKFQYLYSGTKKRSYAGNAKDYHLGEKYILAIDLKSFYPSVNEKQVFGFFKSYYNLDSDISKILTLLSTIDLEYFIKKDIKDTSNPSVAQGISPSSVLVFLCFRQMFDELYEFSQELEIDMTVYVDDITFSSRNEIPQVFIDRLFYIIGSKYGLKIHRDKLHLYKKESVKKITGVYIHNNKPQAGHYLHFRMHSIYYEKIINILNISTLDEFMDFHNDYFIFAGILNCIDEVEGKLRTRNHFRKWVTMYSGFFRAYKKLNRNEKYSLSNIEKKSREELKSKYISFCKKII